MNSGKIAELSLRADSGIGQMYIEGSDGKVEIVPFENGPTCRALIDAFDCYAEPHSIDVSKVVGQEIEWDWDDMGMMLAWFRPKEACDV
jgi:hypothetical protein